MLALSARHRNLPRMVRRMMGDSIFASVTIVDVLRLAGFAVPDDLKRLVRCPLHDDDTPSFRVYPRGFVCFGCGARGGVADLVIAIGAATSRAEAARWIERAR